MTTTEFERKLVTFYNLLKKEKNYLIKGQSEKLEEIVEKKEAFVPLFNAYTGEVTDKMREIIQQIQFQQEENLLLTKQAISYQEVLMQAVKDTMQSATKQTYSKSPNTPYQQQAPTSLVDTEF